MVSYDRIFETHVLSNLPTPKGKLEFTDSLNRIQKFKTDQLGEVFVNYLEPIYLAKYLPELPQDGDQALLMT